MHISATPENLRKWLGEYSDATFSTDMHILYNTNMIFSNLKYNCSIANQVFFGTIILIGVKGGEYIDCPMNKEDIKRYLPQLLKEE